MGKRPKLHIFVFFSTLNGVFCANFIPYPIGYDARDILDQFWNIKSFALWHGGPSNMPKMTILSIFIQNEGYLDIETSKWTDESKFPALVSRKLT